MKTKQAATSKPWQVSAEFRCLFSPFSHQYYLENLPHVSSSATLVGKNQGMQGFAELHCIQDWLSAEIVLLSSLFRFLFQNVC